MNIRWRFGTVLGGMFPWKVELGRKGSEFTVKGWQARMELGKFHVRMEMKKMWERETMRWWAGDVA